LTVYAFTKVLLGHVLAYCYDFFNVLLG